MRLRHARHHIELHQLSDAAGPALLFLHALFGRAADAEPLAALWSGPVYALDFPGHGQSDWLPGGAYYPEYFAASADIALEHIGGAALIGAGLGAYVALLLAGTCPDRIPSTLLLPGEGLAGAGGDPDPRRSPPCLDELLRAAKPSKGTYPFVATIDLAVRPPEYAQTFAAGARRLLLAEDGSARPPWWNALRTGATTHSVSVDLSEALAQLAKP